MAVCGGRVVCTEHRKMGACLVGLMEKSAVAVLSLRCNVAMRCAVPLVPQQQRGCGG